MCLLVRRVVNKTLTQVSSHVSNIVMLTINSRSPWEMISGFNLKRRVKQLIVNNIRNVRRNLSVLLHKLSFGWSNGIFSPASMRRRGEGKHTARAWKVMPILEGTENEILRNFILFYKKEELEENSIFCFIPIQ